jgi:hypothetical protein
MKKILLTVVAALFLATGTAHSDAATLPGDSAREALKMYDEMLLLPEDRFRSHIEFFLKGIATGLLWANAFLNAKGQPLAGSLDDHRPDGDRHGAQRRERLPRLGRKII